jgi:hypothetical protein
MEARRSTSGSSSTTASPPSDSASRRSSAAAGLAALGLVALAAAGCRRGATSTSDAGVASVTPSTSSAVASSGGDAGATAGDAGAGSTAAPPPEITTGSLELVAVGRGPSSKIVWLRAFGDRVWLSGTNVDAYADDAGPLEKARDLLDGLPYAGAVDRLFVTGRYPNLYAVRARTAAQFGSIPELAAFVRVGQVWTPAGRLRAKGIPKAFVPWGDGALVVHSSVDASSQAGTQPGEIGTVFERIGPDGAVTAPDLGVDRVFLTWSASSDGTTLSLLGTRGDDRGGARGLVLLRGKRGAPLTGHTLLPVRITGLEWPGSSVHEDGTNALVLPPHSLTAYVDWRPAGTVFQVTDAVEPRGVPVSGPGGPLCYVRSAVTLGEELYVARECIGAEVATALLRLSRGAAPVAIPLPSIAAGAGGRFAKAASKGGLPCFARSLVVRGRDDVFVEARCGATSATDGEGVPAVFRRGRAQTPIELP